MPSSAAIRAGRAFVEVFLRDDKLAKGLADSQRKLRAFASGASALGHRLLGVGAALAVPLIAGTKVFVDFEQAMANVSTMLAEPQKHMDSFRAGIRRLSVEMGESTGTLAKGLYDILSASIAPEKALAVLEVSARAAKAGLTDTGVAADAITTLLNAYGLQTEQAGDVSDWLFTIVKRGKTTFAELAPQIGLVASTASSAGVSLDELGSLLALLTRNGVKTENAITAVNQVISQFLKPTSEAQAYAASLGFELSSATLKAEGLVGVFRRISRLPPDAIAKLFPDIRALRGAIPALAHVAELTEDMGAMQKRTGATAEAFGKNTATLGHRLNQAKESALQAAEAIGAVLAPAITKVANWIRDNAEAVGEWIREHKGLVTTAAAVAAALIGIGAAMTALGAAAYAVIIPIASLRVALIAIKVFGPILVGELAAAARGIGALAIAHPIAAAVLGLAAAGTALWLAYRPVPEELRKASDEAGKFYQSTVKRGEASRKSLARLEELNRKQRLSNEEMAEARSIVALLSGEYGNLGLSIDKTTGKVNGLAAANARLAEANARVEGVAVKSQIEALEREFAGLSKVTSRNAWQVFLDNEWGGQAAEREQKAYERMDEIAAEISALRSKGEALNDIAEGGPGRAPGGAGASPGAGPADKRALYEKANQSLLDQIRKLELGKIENSLDREVELTKQAYEEKKRAAIEANQDVSLVERALGLELEAIRRQHAADERALWFEIARARIEATEEGGARTQKLLELQLAERREQLRKQGITEKQIAAQEAAERAKAAKTRAEQEKAVADDSARARIEAAGGPGAKKKLFDFDLKARSDALRKQGVGEAAIREREAAERAKFAKEQADEERQLAIDTAKAKAEATLKGPAKDLALFRIDQAERIRRLREQGVGEDAIKASVRAESAKFAAEHLQNKTASAGTFSAIGAARGLGGFDAADRTARNTDKMATLLAQFVQAVKQNRYVFQN